MIPIIFICAVIGFFITNLMPGDPVRVMVGEFASEKQVQEMSERLGLDKPIQMRFVMWLQNVMQGDLGDSLYYQTPVTEAIVSRLEPTLLLATVGLFFGVVMGVSLGIIAAVKHRTVVDQSAMVVSVFGVSIPSFFIAIVLILVFGVKLQWLPVAGYEPIAKTGFGVIKYLLLPGFSLGLIQSGLIARTTRSAMLNVLNQNYIRTAYAKGIPKYKVILVHALKNALSPIVTVIGFSLALLLGGTWIIETIFNIPGTGALAITAISRRDYPIIQGCMLFSTLIYLIVNFLVDISYSFFNPTVKYK
ncbi:ABC di/oligopeptide transporter inner membrane subunit [Cohnella abietis]|uniref:ABC di/oligopeptide transporter inner membrane subunit n=2 Tax=Cohnella abietis TaxID=2507935 RepID=A0A3T1DCT3_9BACL|nr:ABC di/oligopeptide transporter inner membrane subunit [Cohnella abietis]